MANVQPITKLNVSVSQAEEEILAAEGYQFINVDLNEGAGKNRILLWFKKECGMKPVTRIQFSFTDKMKSGLTEAGYEMINRDLNAGVGGDHIFLWYFHGSSEYDIPIVSLEVSTDPKDEPPLLNDGWKRLCCDLNRNAGGLYIYLWVKREKPSYICEITTSVDFNADKQLFELGYIHVDEDTNRAASGDYIFLWYRHSTDKSKALTALLVSTTLQEQANLQDQGFKMLCFIDLNKGTVGRPVYVWYLKKGDESL